MIEPIKLSVEKERQRYVDELVYAHPKKQPPIEFELAGLFHRALPRPVPIQAAASSSFRRFRDTFGFLMVT